MCVSTDQADFLKPLENKKNMTTALVFVVPFLTAVSLHE